MTRFGYVMVTYVATIGVAVASLVSLPLRLVWNASASVPIGFYLIDPPRDVRVGDLVAVMPPNRSPISWWSADISAGTCRC